MKEEDRMKTAFCPGPGMGLYEFCRMPFGVTGGPSSFQRLMDKVLHGLSFATSYIDDVLVHSSSMELHQSHLRQVLDRLAKAGLTLRGTKYKLGLDKVQYLRHVFSKEGMTPDSEKITVVQKWPTLTNATEVRQFLGLASYYRRYVNNFADVAAPLHSLTQKAVEFSWDENCQHAFQMLKVALTQAPVLSYPFFKKEFTLLTDASAVGIGAVLEQEGHPIAYASRSLTPSERQYSVIERECWLLFLRSNSLDIIYWVAHSVYTRTISHYNGSLHRRWKAGCADGLWLFKNLILRSNIGEDQQTAMQMLCPVYLQ